MSSDSAVSELIGAILLVSLVILGVMIVAVSVLSQPPPEDVPQVNALADNISKTVYLYHDGGNSLEPQEIRTIVNGVNSSFSLANNEDWPWSVGKTLKVDYPGTDMPEYIQLIYTGGSTQTLILTAYFVPPVITGGPTLITTVPTPPGPYIITASTGTGGSVSPSGSISVPAGGVPTFVFIPATGYHLNNVTVDGALVTHTGNSYTFPPVTADHNIFGTFAINQNQYTITPSISGGHGTVDPSTAQTVNYGATPTFTFNPDAGYHLDTVTVDGNPVTPSGNSYTFPPVTANHNIVGTFAINQYTITPSISGGHGTVDPSTAQTVNYGATPTFTFNPDAGYHLDTVTVDGNPVTPSGNSYTFPPVTANHNIVGTFAMTKTGVIIEFRKDISGCAGEGFIKGGTYVIFTSNKDEEKIKIGSQEYELDKGDKGKLIINGDQTLGTIYIDNSHTMKDFSFNVKLYLKPVGSSTWEYKATGMVTSVDIKLDPSGGTTGKYFDETTLTYEYILSCASTTYLEITPGGVIINSPTNNNKILIENINPLSTGSTDLYISLTPSLDEINKCTGDLTVY